MSKFDVYYYDKDTKKLAHVERGYKLEGEANSDAETYLYGYTYKIKEAAMSKKGMGKSPNMRQAEKRDAEKNEKKPRKSTCKYKTVKDIMKGKNNECMR